MVTKMFKLTSKSQVTIPDKVKRALGIGPGDCIIFSVEKGHVEIQPVDEGKISLFDLGKKYKTIPKKRIGIEDMNKAIRQGQRRIALKRK
jgi:AbrB family looped-hinge helix DNA binding protein